MATLYGLPKLYEQGIQFSPQTIALIELGGGYDPAKINAFCDQYGIPHPAFTDLGVDGAKNSYTGDPNSADVEVELDICCGLVWSYCTNTPTKFLMVFCPNSDTGFEHGIQQAPQHSSRPSACGISWGQNENQTSGSSYIQTMDSNFQAGNQAGLTWCVASGDAGDSDGGTGKNCDFPSSSPYVVGCGATTIVVNNGAISNESPWNASGGATGGGYSDIEPVPSYQSGIAAATGRGVPDVCAAGDPATGWQTPFGVVGGTSAVAPFMAAYFAVVNAVREAVGLPRLGLVNPLLYQHPEDWFDITSGNNTLARGLITPHFPATQGWDPASGLGALRGALSFQRLSGAQVQPPPPLKYSCVNGICVVDPNGQYATLAACQAVCGGGTAPPPPPPTQQSLTDQFDQAFRGLEAIETNSGQKKVDAMLNRYIDTRILQLQGHP
jgi:kumamolisin